MQIQQAEFYFVSYTVVVPRLGLLNTAGEVYVFRMFGSSLDI